jgi:hypothetical protein
VSRNHGGALQGTATTKRQNQSFDAPSSPDRLQQKISLIAARRATLKKMAEEPMVTPLFKQYKEEYAPIVIEERFQSHADSFDETSAGDEQQPCLRVVDSRQSTDREVQSIVKQVQLNGELISQRKQAHLERVRSNSQLEQQRQASSSKGIHLFIFVHGFQATSLDMRGFKNYVSLSLPRALCLCSTANEATTEGSIDRMGLNLAAEIRKFINDWCYSRDGKTLHLKKITCIGHSLGGLILRSALPRLEHLKPLFHGFLTLGSPHLGYMYNANSLVNAGMWFLKQWKKSQCLSELSMTDALTDKAAYLYTLSKAPGLGWFKHVVLCSSHQDSYAPYDSARIQICSQADPQSLHLRMARNLLQ